MELTNHENTCNAAICLDRLIGGDDVVWYTNEEICKAALGDRNDGINRSMRNVMRGYQKRDKAKRHVRMFTLGQIERIAKSRLSAARRRQIQPETQFSPRSVK